MSCDIFKGLGRLDGILIPIISRRRQAISLSLSLSLSDKRRQDQLELMFGREHGQKGTWVGPLFVYVVGIFQARDEESGYDDDDNDDEQEKGKGREV